MRETIEVDEIVIGAGLTGLSYGNTVAANCSKRIAIVEYHSKVGGYATNFERNFQRKHFTFDCSLHKITGFGETGNLENSLKRIGVLDSIHFYKFEDMTTFRIGGRSYHLSAKYETFKEEMLRYFPTDSAGLALFFQDVETHGLQNYMIARMNLGEYELNRDWIKGSIELSKLTALEYFKLRFKHPDLITFFSSLAINLGVVAEDADALYFLHFAYTFLKNDLVYVKGSSQSLSDALAAAFLQKGGKIYLNEKATRFIAKDGKVEGLETSNYFFKSEKITATCSPTAVVDMADEDVFDENYSSKVKSLKPGLGGFAVYIALDCIPAEIGLETSENLVADEGYLNPASRQTTDGGENRDDRYLRWPLSIYDYHALDKNYGNVLKILVLDEASDWFTLSPKEYRIRKKQVQSLLIDRVSKLFPKLKEHILFAESSTPRTNYRYTLSPGGSSFGYRPIPGRNLRFLYFPKIKGLQTIGTWINGAGYESAICLGFSHGMLSLSSH